MKKKWAKVTLLLYCQFLQISFGKKNFFYSSEEFQNFQIFLVFLGEEVLSDKRKKELKLEALQKNVILGEFWALISNPFHRHFERFRKYM